MGRFIGSLLLLALILGGTLATWPQLADLEMQAPWAQIVSMRGLGAAAALFFAMIFLLVRAGANKRRGYLSALTFILLAFTFANAAILAVRGVFPSALPSPSQHQIRILSWNTLGDEVSVAALADAADEAKAEIIVLPETTNTHAAELAALLLSDLGSEYAVHTVDLDPNYKALSTSVLIEKDLGEYRITDAYGNTNVVPSVVLEPVDRGSRPRIVALHSVSPISGEMESWRKDYAWLGSICQLPNTIIAGDANATPDHLRSLAGCSIASVDSGAGGLGTWPTTLPAILGAPVDQVLFTSKWKAAGYSVMGGHDNDGSDHRPVVAVLVHDNSTVTDKQ